MNIEYLSEEYIDNIYENIAIKLKKERKKQGLSVVQLEKKSGIDRSAIYKMENNKRKFGLENLLKICYALNLKLSDLYEINTDDDGLKSYLKNKIDLMSGEDCYKIYEFITRITLSNKLKEKIATK